ncbi:hypothetical protein BKA70DRAFT_1222312 [Coprinopsis sp. MPI-PUGE-AT-0042]|nr:hypothetical protein BKA70DRAFT_1222312 [Coprinopsis sp. MPI-PUGE-AT-0042]
MLTLNQKWQHIKLQPLLLALRLTPISQPTETVLPATSQALAVQRRPIYLALESIEATVLSPDLTAFFAEAWNSYASIPVTPYGNPLGQAHDVFSETASAPNPDGERNTSFTNTQKYTEQLERHALENYELRRQVSKSEQWCNHYRGRAATFEALYSQQQVLSEQLAVALVRLKRGLPAGNETNALSKFALRADIRF